VVAIGQGITSTNTDAVVIGRAASAGGTANVTIGGGATGTGANCDRIGNGVTTGANTGVVAIGHGITDTGSNGIIIGRQAAGTGSNTIVIGAISNANTHSGVVAIGQSINLANVDAVVIGRAASAGGTNNVTVGGTSTGTGTNSTRIGYGIITGSNTNVTVIGANIRISKAHQFAKGVYAYPLHYGAESRRIDTNTDTSDATNPSRHSDNTAWIGSTTGVTVLTELLLFGVAGERLTVQENEVIHYTIQMTMKREGSIQTGVAIITGAVVRSGGIGTTSLVGANVVSAAMDNAAGVIPTYVFQANTGGWLECLVNGITGTWHYTANIINITRTRTA
jgi:hypothetical protein